MSTQPKSDAYIDGDLKMLVIRLGNIDVKDVRFITGIIALFTDPKNAQKVEDLRNGKIGILYSATGTPFEKQHTGGQLVPSFPFIPSIYSPQNN